MMRVLHVLGGLNRGGAETMVMNLYRTIDRGKVQFDFIIHNNMYDDYRGEIEKMGGKIFVFPIFKGYNSIQYKRVWKTFLTNHPEYKIVHSHVRSYASVFLPIAKKYGLKTIVHSHSTSNGSGLKSIVKYILQKPLVNQADYLFACSQISGEWLFGKKGIKKSNYYMVKNSIKVEKYRFSEATRDIYRNKLKLENKIAFVHIGRLSKAKNHSFLLKVFRKILDIESNAVLVIIGNGELKTQIENQIHDLSLEDNVYMLGAREDVASLLQAMDLLLFPSLWEGLPVTVVEAQASGLPCLVSNTVTQEVNLSSCVKYLPIDEGVDIWAESAIKNVNYRFPEAADLVISSGYDVNVTAKWLIDFYRGMLDG